MLALPSTTSTPAAGKGKTSAKTPENRSVPYKIPQAPRRLKLSKQPLRFDRPQRLEDRFESTPPTDIIQDVEVEVETTAAAVPLSYQPAED